ncbi:MAG: hypothetical protein LBT75_02490 [Bacilli bacterium]|jgi:hypothetical protein|nr:hypothetical protein [Bacilli bacterium]
MNEALFVPNQPSIIDIFISDKKFNNKDIIKRINESAFSEDVNVIDIKKQIIKVEITYKSVDFQLYLQIVANKRDEIKEVSSVLVNEDIIDEAYHCKFYIRSYLDAKHDFVKGYYAQLKVLASLSDNPLLIFDNSQWCLYSVGYLQQCAKYDVDIIDSNLFKIRYDGKHCLFTQGLGRFGIKEVVMVLASDYYTEISYLLSRLARYYIENGQLVNSITKYPEVLESASFGCLLEFSAIKEQYDLASIKKVVNERLISDDYLLFSVHDSEDINNYLISYDNSLEKLKNRKLIYTSTRYFEDEKQLAQKTLDSVIELLNEIDDQNTLMVLASDDTLNIDWYYYDGCSNNKIILKNNLNVLAITKEEVLKWNYKGITPLYAYSLFE